MILILAPWQGRAVENCLNISRIFVPMRVQHRAVPGRTLMAWYIQITHRFVVTRTSIANFPTAAAYTYRQLGTYVFALQPHHRPTSVRHYWVHLLSRPGMNSCMYPHINLKAGKKITQQFFTCVVQEYKENYSSKINWHLVPAKDSVLPRHQSQAKKQSWHLWRDWSE